MKIYWEELSQIPDDLYTFVYQWVNFAWRHMSITNWLSSKNWLMKPKASCAVKTCCLRLKTNLQIINVKRPTLKGSVRGETMSWHDTNGIHLLRQRTSTSERRWWRPDTRSLSQNAVSTASQPTWRRTLDNDMTRKIQQLLNFQSVKN